MRIAPEAYKQIAALLNPLLQRGGWECCEYGTPLHKAECGFWLERRSCHNSSPVNVSQLAGTDESWGFWATEDAEEHDATSDMRAGSMLHGQYMLVLIGPATVEFEEAYLQDLDEQVENILNKAIEFGTPWEAAGIDTDEDADEDDDTEAHDNTPNVVALGEQLHALFASTFTQKDDDGAFTWWPEDPEEGYRKIAALVDDLVRPHGWVCAPYGRRLSSYPANERQNVVGIWIGNSTGCADYRVLARMLCEVGRTSPTDTNYAHTGDHFAPANRAGEDYDTDFLTGDDMFLLLLQRAPAQSDAARALIDTCQKVIGSGQFDLVGLCKALADYVQAAGRS